MEAGGATARRAGERALEALKEHGAYMEDLDLWSAKVYFG